VAGLLSGFERLGDSVQGDLDTVELTLRSLIPLDCALQVLSDPAQSLSSPLSQEQDPQTSNSQHRYR
jgi:hypothetical protein